MLNTGKFAGKTIVITGASRGIGREIGLKLAKDGANIVVAAKTTTPHPKLPGTIYTVAEEVEKAGGKALPFVLDVREEASIDKLAEETVKKFGGIDVLINNASAISLTKTLDTPAKRFDLMHQINTRGTFLMSQKCIPYLKQAKNPHILNLSPPLIMDPMWFQNHTAYSIAKFGMSMCVLGMHEELRPDGIAVNALWPLTSIWTSAMDMITGGTGKETSRKPAIVADAAYAILSRNSKSFTGNYVIDEDILREEGVTDFAKYANDPNGTLMPDFFIPTDRYNELYSLAGKSPNRIKSRKQVASHMDVHAILEKFTKHIDAELVKKTGCVYQFVLQGPTEVKLYVDLKNGSGVAGLGEAKERPDVTFTLAIADFPRLFSGELQATQAFMTKRLSIDGPLPEALKLERLVKKISKA